MTHSPNILPVDISASLTSGMRASSAHEKFSTDKVQLAFGEDDDNRIRHVTKVSRGRECACHCPACSEELIAKQGAKKAWHFAHASGGSCKDALSAAFAKFTSQILNDGQYMKVPAPSFRWGLQDQMIGHDVDLCFEHSEAIRPQEKGPFEVHSTLRNAAGVAHSVRILFRTVKKASKPKVDELRTNGISTLEIDLFSAMQSLALEGETLLIEESWLSEQILRVAERKWLWNAQQDRHFEQMKQDRLGVHIEALKKLEQMSPREDPIEAELLVERLGLSRLLETETIRGERIFGPSPTGWRAMFLRDLVLMPFITEAKEIMISEVGIDRRSINRWMTSRKILRVPAVTRPFSYDSDQIEFRKIAPDIRKPIEVVEEYLRQLWSEDVVRAKPTKDLSQDKRGHFDDRLKPHGMPFWITSDQIIRLAHRSLTPSITGSSKAASRS